MLRYTHKWGDFRDTKWTQKVTDHMYLYAIQVMRILLPYKYKEIDLDSYTMHTVHVVYTRG